MPRKRRRSVAGRSDMNTKRRRKAQLRSNMSPESRERERSANTSRMAQTRRHSSPTSRERERRANTSRMAQTRRHSSPTSRERERRANTSRRAQTRRHSSPTSRERERRANTSRMAQLRTLRSLASRDRERSSNQKRMVLLRKRFSDQRRRLESIQRQRRRQEQEGSGFSRIRSKRNEQEQEFDIFGSPEMEKAVDEFQRALYNYGYPPIPCAVCKEHYPVARPKTHLNSENVCRRCRTIKGTAKFGGANDMDPGLVVPEELQNLSNVEEMLIATVLPFMMVYSLPQGQRAYRGHVICFPQNVQTFAQSLPRRVCDLDVLVVRRRGTNNSHVDFQVRRSYVERAIRWLIKKNPFYKHVQLDEVALQELPEDGDAQLLNLFYDGDEQGTGESQSEAEAELTTEAELQTDVDEQGTGESQRDAEAELTTEAELQTDQESIDQQIEVEDEEHEDELGETASYMPQTVRTQRNANVVEDEVEQFEEGRFTSSEYRRAVSWPEIGTNPINELQTVGYIVRAFPTLFPEGDADIWANRKIDVTPKEYFKHLMKYADPRFAQHDRFRYFAENSVRRWECLQKGSIVINQNPQDKSLTSDEIREMSNSDRSALINRMTHIASSIRGTDKWWSTRKGELLAMCDQMETLPAVFFTLSSADLQWPDLHRLMPENTKHDRALSVRKNPLICVNYFVFRVKEFLKTVMKQMGMKDYWGRFEFQHRGSIHWHGMAWIEKTPNVVDMMKLGPSGEKDLVSFFDKLVSAWNPALPASGGELRRLCSDHPCRRQYNQIPKDKESQLEDYTQLISWVQRHTKCSDYCLTKRDENGKRVCRFGFPFELQAESRMAKVERDPKKKRSKTKVEDEYEFIPRRNDPLLNTHNPAQSFGFRSNVDFSPICDRYCVASYILKYSSKGEKSSRQWARLSSDILRQVPPQTSARSIAQRMLMSRINRDYSAQETVMLLMGEEMVLKTRKFEYVSLRSRQWDAEHGSLPNGVDKYLEAREMFPDRLRHTSMHNFYKYHYVKTVNGQKKLFQRQQGNECIVMPRPYVKPCSHEDERFPVFCEYYLLMHKPFDDISEIVDDSDIVHSYDEFVAQNPILNRGIERAMDTINETTDDGTDQSQEEENGDDNEATEAEDNSPYEPWMLACRRVLGPEAASRSEELSRNYDWNEFYRSLPESVKEKIAPGTNWLKTTRETTVLPPREGTSDTESLNEAQTRAYQMFVDLKNDLVGE